MPLHDILPPIQLIDYTFLSVLGFVSLGLFAFIVRYFYKREKKGFAYDLHILEQCDYQDAKKTALQFSYYGKRIFTDDLTKARFLELQQTLKAYKYIQNTTALPQHLEDNIKQLLHQARQEHA